LLLGDDIQRRAVGIHAVPADRAAGCRGESQAEQHRSSQRAAEPINDPGTVAGDQTIGITPGKRGSSVVV